LNYGARAGYHKAAAVTLKKILDESMFSKLEDDYRSLYTALKTNSKLSVGGYNLGGDTIESHYHQTKTGANRSSTATLLNSSTSKESTFSLDEKKNDDDDDDDDGDGDGDGDVTLKPDTSWRKREGEGLFGEMKNDHNVQYGENEQDILHENDTQDGISNESASSITQRYLQAIEQVDSFVPSNIVSAFNVLHNRIQVINQSVMIDKTQSLVAWEIVQPALYFQLQETIIESWCWPFFIPRASTAVEICLKKFKESINVENENNADLLMDLLDRSNEIRSVQERLTVKQSKRKVRTKIRSLNQNDTSADLESMEMKVPSYGTL